MGIKNVHFEKIIGPTATVEDIQVSLFVVSKKAPRLKKIDLNHLNTEQRAEKLQKWAQEYRFVAVIEIGDKIFAHASNKFVAQLRGTQDLTVGGKEVVVEELTDEAYQHLSDIGKAFEGYISKSSKIETDKQETEKSKEERHEAACYVGRQYFGNKNLISDQMKIDYFIARMKNIPSEIILNVLKQMNEERHELEKNKEKDYKKFLILAEEIRRSILKEETVKNEIKKTTETKLNIREH